MKKVIAFILYLAMGMSGCGGGGSSDATPAANVDEVAETNQNTDSNNSDAVTSEDNTSEVTLSGAAIDGPVINGTVAFYQPDLTLCATTSTGTDAQYTITLPATCVYPLKGQLTGGTDLTTGLANSTTMFSIVLDNTPTTINFNPLSTIIYHSVISNQSDGALTSVTADDLNMVEQIVMNQFGFSINAEQRNIHPMTTAITSANVTSFIQTNEAIMEVVRRSAGSKSVDLFLTALGTDIADGKLDGKKGDTAISDTLTSQLGITGSQLTTRIQNNTALVAVELLTNSLRVTTPSGQLLQSSDVLNNLAFGIKSFTRSQAHQVELEKAKNDLQQLKITREFLQQTKAALDVSLSLAPTSGEQFSSLNILLDDLNLLLTAMGDDSEMNTDNVTDILGNLSDNLSQLTSTITAIGEGIGVDEEDSAESDTEDTNSADTDPETSDPQTPDAGGSNAASSGSVDSDSEDSSSEDSDSAGSGSVDPDPEDSDPEDSDPVDPDPVDPVEPSLPQLTIANVSITEGDAGTTSANVTVTLSTASSETVSVDYATLNGTAASGSDYNAANGSLSFAPGDTEKTISISILGDILNEANETFTITLANPANAEIDDGNAQATITDDDADPTVSLVSAAQTVGENAANISIEIELATANGVDTSIPFQLSGTATADVDYAAPIASVTIPAGETTATITIALTDDGFDEANESLIITLTTPTYAQLTASNVHTITITDNDYPAAVPRTGQTETYGVGDDGDLQPGSVWPDPRLVDNGDGTVTDNLTGLMWIKDLMCIAGTWTEIFSIVDELNSGEKTCTAYTENYSDWRVPNINEIKSLNDIGTSSSMPTDNPFGNPVFDYWSSTSLALDSSYAFQLNLPTGEAKSFAKTDSDYTLPVRTIEGRDNLAPIARTGQTISYVENDDGDLQLGVAWPSPRFVDNNNGTITDNLTGLNWMKGVDCFNGWGALAWDKALDKIVELNNGTEDWCSGYVSGTFNDWRLPTINELETLIDYSRANPSLPADALFLNFPGNYFYSSSTNGYSPSSRWGVLFFNGSMEDISMNTKVLLVRGGTQ